MFLRYANGKLVIFESTGNVGVAVLDWDVFCARKWHQLYDKLVYRKLLYKRTFANMSKLEEFVKKVVGMKYKLSAGKLVKKKNDKDH